MLGWRSLRERSEFRSFKSSEFEVQCVIVVDHLEQHFQGGGHLGDLSLDGFDFTLTPELLAQSLLVVISSFEGGESFYQSLSPVERHLVEFYARAIIGVQQGLALSQDHKGEADEDLLNTRS